MGRRMRIIRCSCMVEQGLDCVDFHASNYERNEATSPLVYTSCFSHSTSFARARPRCEILFFSALGISAYVWPSYSKQASQPGVLSQSLSIHDMIVSGTHRSQSVL